MFRVALKATLGKKLRLFSTAFSVMLGVAFLTGTLVFTDTIRRTFNDLFAQVYVSTDTYVRSSTSLSVGTTMSTDERGRIPDTIVARVRAVPGVEEAQGVVESYAQIVGSNGKAIGNPGQGAPTFGMNYAPGALNPWRLTPGSRAPGSGETVIDQGSANKGHLRVGDTVTVLTQTGPHRFRLVGTVRFGTVDSPGGASAALFDLATAQRVLLGHTGQVDAVMVHAAVGVSQAELTARIARVLPHGVEALTGAKLVAETQNSVQKGLSFFNTFLLVFAVIGLVVACFTIYNTFQIIVSQRIKEMALLRAVGATRVQVLGAQLFEAVFVGVIASATGLAAGVVVAGGLKGMLAAFGVDIPAGGTVFTLRTALVGLGVGLLVTVVSAVFPSARASRVPPLAAIRDVNIDRAGQSRLRLLYGGFVTALGIAGFAIGLGGAGVLWVGIGALLSFVGVFMLMPLAARPLTRVFGAPLPVVSGVVGSLARENAMRNPKRTARTGGALMIGVALVAAITIISASAKAWTRDVFGQQFTGDYVVSTNTYTYGGLSPKLAESLNRLPQVAAATGVRVGAASVTQGGAARTETYVAVDPATVGKVFDIGMVKGTIDRLTTDGILVERSEANRRHLDVGSTLRFKLLNGTVHTLKVEGIYTKKELAGLYVVSHALHEQSGVDQFDFSVYIKKASTVSNAAAGAAINRVAAAYANANVESRGAYIASQAAQLDQLVNLMYGLLALAVLIALFSIANTMALSIYERTRELGLLRAVGMTRHQMASAVRWEAMLIAVLGTCFGIVLGGFFGWSISVAIRGAGLGAFSIPVPALVVVCVLAVAGGFLASLRPARRAARLDVLRAIASE